MNEPECRGDMRVDILLGGSEHLDCLFTRELRPIGVHITSRRTRYRIVIVSWLSLSTEERQELCGSLNSQYLLCVTCDALYFPAIATSIAPWCGCGQDSQRIAPSVLTQLPRCGCSMVDRWMDHAPACRSWAFLCTIGQRPLRRIATRHRLCAWYAATAHSPTIYQMWNVLCRTSSLDACVPMAHVHLRGTVQSHRQSAAYSQL